MKKKGKIEKSLQVILISLINIYKVVLSPILELLFGKGCRFSPTCSQYAIEVLGRYGVLKGLKLSIKRIIKCQPFSKVHIDPVDAF